MKRFLYKFLTNNKLYKELCCFRVFISILIAILSGSLLFNSCVKEEYDLDKMGTNQWNPNFAAPLVYSELTLYDVLQDYDSTELFVEDSTHLLYLVYNRRIFSQSAQELIYIPDQNVNTNHTFNLPAVIPIGDSASIPTYTNVYIYSTLNNEKLDSMILDTGQMIFQITSDVNHNGKIVITMPDVTLNGTPFKRIIPYTYSGSVPVTINASYDLSGYKVAFANNNNEVIINYDLTVYGDNNPDNSPYYISMGDRFAYLKYSRVFGYFDQYNFTNKQESVKIKFFSNYKFGTINWEDPRVSVYVSNSFGMPLALTFNQLASINLNTPATVNISGSGMPNPWNVGAPTVLGDSITSSFKLHSGNSNIKDAINIAPQFVSYDVSALSNPSGLVTQNFILDTSRFSVNVEVELPLHGTAKNFILQDTLDFKFEDINEIEWFLFKIKATNGFPIDAKIQCFFTDSDFVVLDSLFKDPPFIVTAAPIGPAPELRVISPSTRLTSIKKYDTDLDRLIGTEKIIIRAWLATTDTGNEIVKIYSDYNIALKLATQAQLKIKY